MASEESQVPKNASESQKVDAQEEAKKVQNCPETNQAVAHKEAEKGKAQSTASDESQLNDPPASQAVLDQYWTKKKVRKGTT